MDDFNGDLDYLNDIRDAQMLQRAPRRKFEILDTFEYYDDDEFVDRLSSHKKKLTLTHVRWAQCWTKKSYQKRYN